MPPSQLKRLKASLREQGITGPQKSKKQKKNQKTSADQHAKKAAALASIREAANPFDFKHLSRPKKFEYVTNQPQNAKKTLGRPGVTKSHGEETRRKTLLPEMNRRNKVGGIVDRRIGEDDPSMTLDDKMMARFEREQQRKRGNVFDLEEADDEVELTHGGKSLRFDADGGEDYDAASVSGSSDGEADGFLQRKRRRDEEGDDILADGADEPKTDEPERKKSKTEVMKELIAKSKMHKYERQQQKEDDDDLIEELNKGMPDMLAALRGHKAKQDQALSAAPETTSTNEFGMNPERAALLVKSKYEVDRDFDKRVKQLTTDQRAKPANPTLKPEDAAKKEAGRLQELERQRELRMKGLAESPDDDEDSASADDNEESIQDDAREFGIWNREARLEEEEDEFELDADLIASGSEIDSDVSEDDSDDAAEEHGDDDDEFLQYVMPESSKTTDNPNNVPIGIPGTNAKQSKLAYTFECPRSHDELLTIFKDVALPDLPTAIVRVRSLHHPGLQEDNKNKLADFACALVDHIDYLANQQPPAPLAIIETIIRHIHSLSRSYAIQIATRFRHHLKQIQAKTEFEAGDLTIFTAIGSIYPTSDHFHQVVTPSILLMARWMGLATSPKSAKDIATGAYISTLCLQYQRLSKRYIPEIIRWTTLALNSPHMSPKLLTTYCTNITTMINLWQGTPAFTEIFTPLLKPLKQHTPRSNSTIQRLTIALQTARLARLPQTLHNHRPLPIKTSIPKFEGEFDPTKHYDPDRERADANKLRKEYKREKKGAMRELRKDANFIAREKLRDKKEKDRAYEEKYRKLVAEIQGEEGREANAYEREKKGRKRGR